MAARHALIIIMDDLCWGDIAAHGNPVVQTPNLDRFYRESAHLSRYRSGPVCSPARASLLTGRFHPRTKVLDTYCGRSQIDPNETTLAEHLRDQGFTTGCFGKWHLGDNFPMRPQDKGFDEVLYHLAGGIGQPGDYPANHAREDECYFDPVLHHNGEAVQTSGYCTDIFTDATIDFFQERADKQRCFAYLATNAPHCPHIVADEWADPYRQQGLCETHARVYGMVSNIDWNVGRIMQALEQQGILDDTLILFTSDHGPCGSARDAEAGDRWNDGLRDIKMSLYEGGVRVPSFWRLPGTIPADSSIACNTNPIDVAPSMCELLGVEAMGQGDEIDGQSLTPLLTGGGVDASWRQRTLCMQWHRGDYLIRDHGYHVVRDQWKLVRPHADAGDELYDLSHDPGEQSNCIAAHPDIAQDLRACYLAWFDDVCGSAGPHTQDAPSALRDVSQEPHMLFTENDRRPLNGEGWRDDSLRGYWWLRVSKQETVQIHLQFADHVPAGEHFIRLNDTIHALTSATSIQLTLPPGRHQIEAWRDCGANSFTGGFLNRYASVLYLEITPEDASSAVHLP